MTLDRFLGRALWGVSFLICLKALINLTDLPSKMAVTTYQHAQPCHGPDGSARCMGQK